MSKAKEVIAKFEGDEFESSGDAIYPFWDGRELETIITFNGHITYPTHRQPGLLDQLLNYPRNIRPEVEHALFDHYQNDIYESVMEVGRDDEELTPKLKSSEQIRDLLGEPTVRISYIGDDEPDPDVRFRLSYHGCPWDEEHGFGIQMQDWKVTEFGGEIA
jgi:hypothetical protein